MKHTPPKSKDYRAQTQDNCTASLVACATLGAKVARLKEKAPRATLRKMAKDARRALKLWENNNGKDYLEYMFHNGDHCLAVKIWTPLCSVVYFLEEKESAPRVNIAKLHARDLCNAVNDYAGACCYGIDPYPKDIAQVVQFLTR